MKAGPPKYRTQWQPEEERNSARPIGPRSATLIRSRVSLAAPGETLNEFRESLRPIARAPKEAQRRSPASGENELLLHLGQDYAPK